MNIGHRIAEGHIPPIALAAIAITVFGGLVSGCDDGDPAGPELPEFPTGTWEMELSEAEAPIPLLAGGWTLTIEPSGALAVSHPNGSVEAEITVSDGQITVRDISGALACEAPVETGVYTWTETASTLSFQAVTDGCDGRRFVLTHSPWAER